MNKISVTCLTYKRLSVLEEAVYSFIKQNYKNKEMIIVNDNPGVQLSIKHPDITIINLDKRCSSLGEKRNIAVSKCSGDIIVPLDDDDIILPEYLDLCSEKIEGFNWYYPNHSLVFDRNNHWIKINGNVMPNTFIFKKEVWDKVKYPNTNFDENGQFMKGCMRYYKGHFSSLAKNQLKYICGWDKEMNFSYHTHLLGKKNIADSKENDVLLADVEKYIITKQLFNKRGHIRLIPNWRYDYVGMVNNLIGAPS